jgi:hypothetical protein
MLEKVGIGIGFFVPHKARQLTADRVSAQLSK